MEKLNQIRIGALLHNLEDSSSFFLVLKKCIDYCFGMKQTTSMSVNEIINFLASEEGVCMDFSQSDIVDCCKSFNMVYKISGHRDRERISISDEVYQNILVKLEEIDFDKLIKHFYEKVLDQSKRKNHHFDKIAEAIYLFLYNLLIESEIEYSKLFQVEKAILAKKVRKIEFVEIINDFIQWEDEVKNNILYSLYGAGIEFSILSVKKDLISLDTLQNRTIYLDTNIIFRLLGLNGPELKERTEDFLKKFQENKMRFCISSLTMKEFESVLRQKVLFIMTNMNYSSKYTIGNYPGFGQDPYSFSNFFIEWRSKHPGAKNTSLVPFINAQLQKMTEQFQIIIEKKFKASILDKDEIDKLVDYYKQVRYHKRKSDSIIETDVKNYLYMLHQRSETNIKNSIFTDFYFLSSDYELIHFDNLNKDNSRVVFHPARLYSVILKFSGRINKTELMSFIRLLKVDIKTEEKVSESTKLIINDQIHFYEQDETMQKPYMDSLFENSALDQIELAEDTEKRSIINDIFEKVSKRLLADKEKEVSILKKEYDMLKQQIEESKKKREITKITILLILKILLIISLFVGIYFLLIYYKITPDVGLMITIPTGLLTIFSFLRFKRK